MSLVFLFSSVCKKINSSAMVVIKTLTSPATPLRRFSGLFLLCLGLLSPSLVYAATFANHAVGSATAGATKWATLVSGSSCSTASCHGAVVPGVSPTTNGTFGYSSGAFLTYANSPDDLAGSAAAIGGAGGMPQDNIDYAGSEKNDLSAYLASFVTPELTAIADFTLAPGAPYPNTASRQISPRSGQDYIVNTTTFSATGLPTGLGIGASTGVVTGNVPNNFTTPQTFAVTLRAANSAASPTTGTVSFNLTVQAVQNITFPAPSLSQGGSLNLSGVATSSNPGGSAIVYTSNTPAVCTVSGTTVTVVGSNTQNCQLVATQPASGNFIEGSTTINVTVGPGVQNIQFTGNSGAISSVISGGPTAFTATSNIVVNGTGVISATGGGSNNPVTFTIPTTTSVCSIASVSGNNLTVNGLSVGTCTVVANQAAGGGFNAATQVSLSFGVGQASQIINFGAAPTIVEGGTGAVTATGGASGNPVTLTTQTPAICSITGNIVTAVSVGACTIAANQIGNVNFAAAVQVTQNITIGSAPPVASAATFQVNLNTPTKLDLSPFTSGSSITGVNITASPAHGTLTVSGEKVTYTPVTDYFGSDSFTYVAFGTLGSSAPAVVTINIVGRPDPRKNANLMSMLTSQNDAAKRFARAQVTNFQQRTESLHGRRAGSTNTASSGGAIAGFDRAVTPTLDPAAKISAMSKQLAQEDQAREQGGSVLKSAPVMLAYQEQANKDSNAAADAQGQKLAALGNTLLSVLSSKSINLAGLSTTVGGEAANSADAVEVWMMGNIRFGARENDDGAVLSTFRTNGVTVGIDKRFSENLVVGAGFGYAHEKTDISDDGSESVARGVSAAVYASYMPTDKIFVDGLLGYGVTDFDSDRFVAPADDFAKMHRKGEQYFGSLTAGYEYRNNGMLFSPYARFNLEYNRLDSGTEKGAGLNALHFSEQNSRTAQLSLGFRAEATHEIDGGLATPHARIELQGNLDRNGSSNIRYADQLNSSGFNLSSSNNSSYGVLLGFGNDFILNNGVKLGFEYQTLRGEGDDNSQSINFRVSKELGGPDYQPQIDNAEVTMSRLGIRIDAGYTYDDNVSRSELASDQEQDSIYSIKLSKLINIPIKEHTRIVLNGFVGGERFDNFRGLENVSAGVQGELQYRPSAEFSAPTLGVFAKASIEEFESRMRDGSKYSVGVSVRKPWTDRINLFSALSYNIRETNSEVFDTKDTSARFNIDYMVTKKSSLYAGLEYRFGDTLSAGSPSLKNADTADVLEQDDVFTNKQLTQYRFDGKTYLGTIGYNLPLGPKDSLDFSWRYIRSSPDDEPSYVNGTTRYIVNQYSLVYLVRF